MKYWDASALVPLLLDQPFSETALSIVQNDDDIVAWWGTPTECCSAIARLRREEAITIEDEQRLRAELDALSDYWNEVSPSDEVRAIARRLLSRHPLRAADSLQLAAALVWAEANPEGLVFVCLDGKLRAAAQEEGFTVAPSQAVFESLSKGIL